MTFERETLENLIKIKSIFFFQQLNTLSLPLIMLGLRIVIKKKYCNLVFILNWHESASKWSNVNYLFSELILKNKMLYYCTFF